MNLPHTSFWILTDSSLVLSAAAFSAVRGTLDGADIRPFQDVRLALNVQDMAAVRSALAAARATEDPLLATYHHSATEHAGNPEHCLSATPFADYRSLVAFFERLGWLFGKLQRLRLFRGGSQ